MGEISAFGEIGEAGDVSALGADLVAMDAYHTLGALAGWECRPYHSWRTLTATIRPQEGWLSGAQARFPPDALVRVVHEASDREQLVVEVDEG